MDTENQTIKKIEPKEKEDPFLKALPTLLDETIRNLGFRLTSKGVFIVEGYEQHAITSYQQWLKEQTGKESTRNEDKCRKRLFGENPKSYYLLDGKKCLFGFFLKGKPETIEASLKNKIHLTGYRGEPLDPKDFLHPKDPYLEKLKHIKLHYSSSQGSYLIFSNKKANIKVSFEQLKAFASIARSNEIFCDKNPKAVHSLRDCIVPLARILKTAHPSKQGSSILVLKEHLKLKPAIVLKSAGFSFFLDKESTLLGVADAKASLFKREVKEEILALQTKHPLTSIKGFTLLSGKSQNLGKIRIKGNSYLIESRTFFNFTRLLLKQKKLDTLIGTKSVMQKLVSALQASKEATPKLEKELSGGRKISGKDYRSSGKWGFVVTDKNCVSGVFLLKKGSNIEQINDKPKKKKKRRKPKNKRPNAL